jgi:acyl-CoA thioesterase
MKFSDASRVQRAGDGVWTAEVQPGWDIFGISNGGYLMSIAARAMSDAADGRLPVTVSAHFTRPVSAGPARVTVETIKEGRNFTTVRADLTSDSGGHLTLLGSLSIPEAMSDEVVYLDGEPPDLPDPEDCVRNVPAEDGPLPPPVVGLIDQRIHPDDATVLTTGPSGVAQMRGWFRLLDGEPMDAFTLLFSPDAFPPAVFNTELPLGWTPTVEMTTQIRSAPRTEWLRCRFTTRFVTGGMLEEDGEIWDQEGRLLAISRQLALVAR